MELYEQAIKVPLIVRFPGTKARRIDSPVSHLDVMPTLLDLLGIEPPADLDAQATTVSPLCMPARASFINGLHPYNHNIWTNRENCRPTMRRSFITCSAREILGPEAGIQSLQGRCKWG